MSLACRAFVQRMLPAHTGIVTKRCFSYTSCKNASAKKQEIVSNKNSSRWIKLLLAGGVGGYCGYKVISYQYAGSYGLLPIFFEILPLRSVSRLWGRVNNVELPIWLRSPVFKLYIWMFNCKMEEAAVQDLMHYRNLGELFRRRIKLSLRPVDRMHSLTSPSDGRILIFGEIKDGQVEQVKGKVYPLDTFLGPPSWLDVKMNKQNIEDRTIVDNHQEPLVPYETRKKKNARNKLYHCVIYLAPGDYHGFHSPSTWMVTYRRHFPGNLISVSPVIVRLIAGLFTLNERVAYMGSWVHGFFSMTAVGATNVGSIKVYHDKTLVTNLPDYQMGTFFDKSFANEYSTGLGMKKGEYFGEFNLGSTIVLIFEAPKDFQFTVESGQKIEFGQALGQSTPAAVC